MRTTERLSRLRQIDIALPPFPVVTFRFYYSLLALFVSPVQTATPFAGNSFYLALPSWKTSNTSNRFTRFRSSPGPQGSSAAQWSYLRRASKAHLWTYVSNFIFIGKSHTPGPYMYQYQTCVLGINSFLAGYLQVQSNLDLKRLICSDPGPRSVMLWTSSTNVIITGLSNTSRALLCLSQFDI
jgi:hypothetical protein